MNLSSLRFDAGFFELRVLVIRRGSEVNLASELQHLDNFEVADIVLSFLLCDTPRILCPNSVTLGM